MTRAKAIHIQLEDDLTAQDLTNLITALGTLRGVRRVVFSHKDLVQEIRKEVFREIYHAAGLGGEEEPR